MNAQKVIVSKVVNRVTGADDYDLGRLTQIQLKRLVRLVRHTKFLTGKKYCLRDHRLFERLARSLKEVGSGAMLLELQRLQANITPIIATKVLIA